MSNVKILNGYDIKDATARTEIAAINTDITNLTNNKANKATTLSGYGITDAYTKSEINSFNSYSTSETEIGTWIDGSAIYRKVIDMGTLPDTDEIAISHGVTNLGYIIHLYGVAKRSTDDVQFPLPYVDVNLEKDIEIVATSTTLNIRTSEDRTNLTECYLVMEYTKETPETPVE